jgi:hypothetical protein
MVETKVEKRCGLRSCGCHVGKNLYSTKASVGNPEESIGNFLPARQRRDSQNDKRVSFILSDSLTLVVSEVALKGFFCTLKIHA